MEYLMNGFFFSFSEGLNSRFIFLWGLCFFFFNAEGAQQRNSDGLVTVSSQGKANTVLSLRDLFFYQSKLFFSVPKPQHLQKP